MINTIQVNTNIQDCLMRSDVMGCEHPNGSSLIRSCPGKWWELRLHFEMVLQRSSVRNSL